MSLIVLDIELTEKNKNEELGHFIEGSVQGFSFCPPKTFRRSEQTTWNTSHLHRIAWSSGKLDYEKLFAVFYDIKVMNSEVFAEGFEKCRLLSRLLGQNVENFDDYGSRSFWRRKSEQFVDLLYRQKKASLCGEESKSVRRLGSATLIFVKFVRVYCICVYY